PHLPTSPTLTLSPYTTLFRSEALVLAGVRGLQPDVLPHAHPGAAGHAAQDLHVSLEPGLERLQLLGNDRLVRPGRRHPGHPLQLDRKSTRLNSSHRTISYAVF